MLDFLLTQVDSCRTMEHLELVADMSKRDGITPDVRLMILGAIRLKMKQMSDIGWAKISGPNRFPCDDEQPETTKTAHQDGPY